MMGEKNVGVVKKYTVVFYQAAQHSILHLATLSLPVDLSSGQ